MVDWNLLITIVVIVIIILWVLYKMFEVSPRDLMENIREFMGDKKDTVEETVTEIYE
jgi:hypothetical protein